MRTRMHTSLKIEGLTAGLWWFSGRYCTRFCQQSACAARNVIGAASVENETETRA